MTSIGTPQPTSVATRGRPVGLPPCRVDAEGAGLGDAQLLERLKEADEDALALLMHRYWNELHAFLEPMVQNEDLAEDLAQETFLRLWTHRETWRPEGSLRGLLYQIGRRLAFDNAKRRRRRAARLGRLRPPAAIPTPADVLDLGELDHALGRAIAALPERRRVAFLMARWEGRSHREIAAALGISVQTVANQLTSALAALRADLEGFLVAG